MSPLGRCPADSGRRSFFLQLRTIGRASLMFDEWLMEQVQDLEEQDIVTIVGHEIVDRNTEPKNGNGGYRAAVRDLKNALVAEALQRNGGSRKAAARELGVSRSYLQRLLKR